MANLPEVDLTPRDYSVRQGKRKEPFFQSGGLTFLITYIVVGMTVLMAFRWVKGLLLPH